VHPSKFQRFSLLGFVTATASLTGSQPNFAGRLAVSLADALYTHIFRGLLPADGNSPRAIFTLRPSVAFFYILQRPSAKLCGVVYKEWNYRTFAEGATYIRLGGQHARWASAHSIIGLCIALHFRQSVSDLRMCSAALQRIMAKRQNTRTHQEMR